MKQGTHRPEGGGNLSMNAMSQIAIRTGPEPIDMKMGSAFRLDDQELFELCVRNPELRIERSAEGDLIVMTPAGWESGRRNAEIVYALTGWAKADGSGVVADSSTGFLLPNGAMRAPDAAWVETSRLEGISPEQKKRFLPLCPDFVIELRSPSDALAELRVKMEEYRDAGARLGWLVDPDERRVHVYRPGRPIEVLDGPTEISGDPELPGFILHLGPIWEPA
jgi:Uma2 family endonuclease